MKEGIRILGIDDAPFEHSDEETFLTGVVYRGTEFIEDIRSVEINVDSDDSSEKVIELYNKCNNPGQIKAVLLDGISFAGFNVLELDKISEEVDKPVVSVTSNRPNRESFRKAMKDSGNYDENFEKLPESQEIELEEGKVFYQSSGCSSEETERIVRASIIHGLVPEPIRVADMIGRGIRDY